MGETRRTALITGSGRNIGRASALALAKNGINIIVNGSSNQANCDAVADEVRALGVDALVAMGNIGNPDDLGAIAAKSFETFGRVDILVNNAAVRPNSPFLETGEDEWERILNIDFHAARRLAKLCLPGMIEAGWGRIINFAGMNAIHGYNGRAPVSVSKHASWGLTKSLAKEFGKQGVTTNIISPGPIGPDEAEPEMREHIESMVGRVPVGRLGKNQEIGAMVALLASDDGAFINGQLLQVNGGAET
ncbi:MAG: SDR family oxidoreductase [Rhodospirillales bacterium]|nr:SDR family oxidoreductase [Rhodospirillales bacterium]MBO6788717.1 SDR family oxidoreductase [Rhodospirillales bacterium]